MKSHKTFEQGSKLNLELRINYLMEFQFPCEPDRHHCLTALITSMSNVNEFIKLKYKLQ